MKRAHFIIPSILLACAAGLAVKTVAGTTHLGLAGSSKPVAVATPAPAQDDALAAQEQALNDAERQIDAIARSRMPKLPPVPKRIHAAAPSPRVSAAPPVQYTYAAAPSSGTPSSASTETSPAASAEHEDEHEDSGEDEEGVEDDD